MPQSRINKSSWRGVWTTPPRRFLLVLCLGLLTAALIFLVVPWNRIADNFSETRNGMAISALSRLERTLNAYVDEGILPGGVLFVTRHGEPVLHRAFGWLDREANMPMRVDSLYRVASQAKVITSAGILILEEDGLIGIDDEVSKYLPEFLETTVAVPDTASTTGYRIDKANRQITIRDLLTHTAGIDYGYNPAQDLWRQAGAFGWYLAGDKRPLRDKVARIATLPMAAQPGERFVYGFAADILGAVIEVITGEPLGAFLRERIFMPLGMADTYFYVPPSKAHRLAVVYSPSADGLIRAAAPGRLQGGAYVGQGHYVEGPRLSHSGGAGLVSTAPDFTRFLEMMRMGGSLDGVRILRPGSVKLMTSNQLPPDFSIAPGVGFGFGLKVIMNKDGGRRPENPGTYGWGGAYHTTFWVDPAAGLVVVYFSQVIPVGGLDDHNRVREMIYDAIVD